MIYGRARIRAMRCCEMKHVEVDILRGRSFFHELPFSGEFCFLGLSNLYSK